MVLGGFRSFLVLVLTHIPFYIRERHKAKIKKQKISLVVRFYARDLKEPLPFFTIIIIIISSSFS